MKHLKATNSKLIFRNSRVFIPPNTCRTPFAGRNRMESADTQPAIVLPAGSLKAWPRSAKTYGKFSDRELGRVARQMIRAGQSVDRTLWALVASEEGIYPPPETPPTDPGEPANDNAESDSHGIVPIKDNELAFTRPVFDQIAQELPYRGREEAGLLLGPKGTQLVTQFVRDKLGTKTASSFTLHTPTLNEVILGAKQWDLELLAVIHCHPDGVWQPSGGDIRYVRDLFAHPKNGTASQFFMPLVVSGRLLPYLLFRDEPDRVVRAGLKIIG